MQFVEDYFSTSEKKSLVNAIEDAEQLTSGEIRIYFEKSCPSDPLERGKEIFEKLGMHRTQLHNGVLIYISLRDHKFSIVADKGIHEKVPKGFWEDIRDGMRERFRNESIIEGLKFGIAEAGKQLSEYFPIKKGDKDELSNELVFGGEEE